MGGPRYPSLYQINTRVWLTELSRTLQQPATLDDVPDFELDRLSDLGFDWLWFLSVWRTGTASQRVSRTNPEWRNDFRDALPDVTDADVAGSGFAIVDYSVSPTLGGDAALTRLRERMRQRGLKLMLDFVPNHMGLDHPWIDEHPDYFIQGTSDDLNREPQNYVRLRTRGGDAIFAYGRDPYFAGWPDTLQIDYANPDAHQAMANELLKIASQCDGLRCDMAMLVLPDVFERTWGRSPAPFWPQAIHQVRELVPDFCFMAEVYWDLEWTLQQQGFDYAYDKRLYDRLHEQQAQLVRDHLKASLDYQAKLARFLENHDEPRAAASFPWEVHQAAAAITYLTPGLRFFHQGQLEGRRKRISPHLVRGPDEPCDEAIAAFYSQLFNALRTPIVREGDWSLLDCTPAWDGNDTHDCFIVFAWRGANGATRIVAVNFAAHQSQCHARLPFADLAGRTWRIQDQLRDAHYDWRGEDLLGKGLYLDMPAWQACVYDLIG